MLLFWKSENINHVFYTCNDHMKGYLFVSFVSKVQWFIIFISFQVFNHNWFPYPIIYALFSNSKTYIPDQAYKHSCKNSTHQRVHLYFMSTQCGALTAADMKALEEELSDLLAVLRPQAVSIVDAFDLDDFILDSVLGSKDGNVYQRYVLEA